MEPAAIIVIVIVLSVPLLWVTLVTAISKLGGWAQLAEHYEARDDFQGQRWRFEGARILRKANYSGVLTFGANARGLYISTFFLFRPGHPALFIPWTDITMRRTSYFAFPYTELKFRRGLDRGLLVRERLGKHLAAAAGLPWPPPDSSQ